MYFIKMNTVLNLNPRNNKIQPMFLGEPLGILNLTDVKYPKFVQLFKEQRSSFWSPDEIPLVTDRFDYSMLSEEEKFIFEKNISFQTLGDSFLSRSIDEIKKYVTLNELSYCMNAWSFFEESIHSDSYNWILENISKNPHAFFQSMQEDVELVNRMSEIRKTFDELLSPKVSDIKEKLFNSILYMQIMEGIIFYISFACSFFFGYKGKMTGNADIIKLIKRDETFHISITQNIIKYWKENEDEGFQDILKKNEQKIYDVYGLAVDNEKKWAEYIFSRGTLLGLNQNTLGGYIEWLANNRLQSIGYKKIYDIKQNPIGGWLDSYLDSSRSHDLPQEKNLTDYKKGSRDTSINLQDFSNFTL